MKRSRVWCLALYMKSPMCCCVSYPLSLLAVLQDNVSLLFSILLLTVSTWSGGPGAFGGPPKTNPAYWYEWNLVVINSYLVCLIYNGSNIAPSPPSLQHEPELAPTDKICQSDWKLLLWYMTFSDKSLEVLKVILAHPSRPRPSPSTLSAQLTKTP